MKKIYLAIILLVSIITFTGCSKSSGDQNNTQNENIEITRTGTISNDEALNTLANNSNRNQINNEVTSQAETTPQETIISEFSTTIKSKSSNRLNNIQITCSKLNDTVVEPHQEFSFCQTIGKATQEQGYKKADVIINKSIRKALGGGNCQVSSTLYNTVLGAANLEVTERHPHGKKVNYVPEGKDAAVSYGSKDFKFINNLDNQIKIYASTDNNNVYVKIVSVK